MDKNRIKSQRAVRGSLLLVFGDRWFLSKILTNPTVVT